MNQVTFPHDKTFKSSMRELKVAQEFFAAHLPANIKDIVDLASIKLENTSFIDEKMQNLETDMLFKAKFHNKTGYIPVTIQI